MEAPGDSTTLPFPSFHIDFCLALGIGSEVNSGLGLDTIEVFLSTGRRQTQAMRSLYLGYNSTLTHCVSPS